KARAFKQFVEMGEVVRRSGLDRSFTPIIRSHETYNGEMRVDITGAAATWLGAGNYAVPSYDNQSPRPPGGLYSPFSADKFYQRMTTTVELPDGEVVSQTQTWIVRVALKDGPSAVTCVDSTEPSSRCFRFQGAVKAAAIGANDVFYVAEAGTPHVWAHDLGDTTNTWHKVATGFEDAEALFTDRNGGGVLYVLDGLGGGGVYAFIPDFGRTFDRADAIYPGPGDGSGPIDGPTACVADAPCIAAATLVNLSEDGSAVDTCIGGIGFGHFGFEEGAVHIGDVRIDAWRWNDTEVCVDTSSIKPKQVSTQLWLELPDGTESNRVEAVMPLWVDSVEPAVVAVGDTITIRGGNFDRLWPAGFTLGALSEALLGSLWTDTEISGRLPFFTEEELTFRLTTIVRDPALFGTNGPGATVSVPIQPAVLNDCVASAGLLCEIHVTGGAQTVKIDGTEVPVILAAYGALKVEIPDLPPGDYSMEVSNTAGRSAMGSATVLGWTRHTHNYLTSTLSFGAIPLDGMMQGIPGGGLSIVAMHQPLGLLPDEGWWQNAPTSAGPVAYGSAFTDRRLLDKPFARLSFSYGGSGRRYAYYEDPPRFCTDGMLSLGAGVMEPASGTTLTLEAGFGYGGGNDNDQLLRILPTPAGMRLGGLVLTETAPFLAVLDDATATTELYLAYADVFGRQAVLDGQGQLIRAGEYAFLAGGEPQFTGQIHEIFMEEEQLGEPRIFRQRAVPAIQADLPIARQPLFAGSDEGALYAAYIDDAGALRITRFVGGGDAWEDVALVPDTVPGVPAPAELLADPSKLQIVDFGVLFGRVYLLAQYDDGERVRLEVYHQANGGWKQTHEELASYWPTTDVCVGPYVDASYFCGSDSGVRGCAIDECTRETPTWRTRVGSANRARMNASHGALWVSYEVRYADSVYIGVLGDDKIMVAKLAVVPDDPL
ncbi:MAG: hypothetical protein ACI9WU_003545, partial [Myxococcota bacterium]